MYEVQEQFQFITKSCKYQDCFSVIQYDSHPFCSLHSRLEVQSLLLLNNLHFRGFLFSHLFFKWCVRPGAGGSSINAYNC